MESADSLENEAKMTKDSELSETSEVDMSTASAKRGRIKSTIWFLFTEDSNPQLKKSAVCKHCKTLVNYHKKTEYAQRHLNNCKPFIKMMMGVDVADRPEWFYSRTKSKVHHTTLATAGSSSIQSHCHQKAMTQYTLPPMSNTMQHKFEEAIALHYYVTGNSFQRIEEQSTC